MKVAKTPDWRDDIAFGIPVLVADVVPGEPTRCAICGSDSAPRSRSELWAVKHPHPHHHDGYVRFYCGEHVPRPAPAAAAPVRTTAPARGERRLPARRSAASVDKVRAMCPNCFLEISATGECGNCGWSAA